MADSLTQDIRDRVSAYLTKELSLPDFQDWLVGATWDVEERDEPTAVDLTYEIKLAMAEYSRGDIRLDELRHRLSGLVEAPVGTR